MKMVLLLQQSLVMMVSFSSVLLKCLIPVDAFPPPTIGHRNTGAANLVVPQRDLLAHPHYGNDNRVSFSFSQSIMNAASSESSPSVIIDDKVIEQQKKVLLRAVGGNQEQIEGKSQTDAILEAAAELEANNHVVAPVSGKWSLLFSTMSSSADKPLDGVLGNLDTLPRKVSNAIYKTLFRFLPALAGGQERDATKKKKSSKENTLFKAVNEQIVDVAGGMVDNTVDLRILDGKSPVTALRIRVRGTAKTINDDDGERLLEIVFTDFSFGPLPPARFPPTLNIPLPRPVGSLQTTFCDNDLRLSRGGRGGLFVLKRIRTE